WTREQFEEEKTRDGFLEWAEVHGHSYGTLRSEVTPHRERGIGVLLDIDVQGAAQVRQRCPDSVSIFLEPPSLEVLEQRLRLRGTEDEATLQRRLRAARGEMEQAGAYNFRIINDNLDRAVAEVEARIRAQF